MRQIAVIASLIYGVLVGLAASLRYELLAQFALEASIRPWRLAAVPGMLAMLFALLLYQDASKRIHSINQSLSRGVLVALLTWLMFSMLMMWAWCAPDGYGACLRDVLLASGMIGGGQVLIAALLAAAIVGWIIVHPPPVRRIDE